MPDLHQPDSNLTYNQEKLIRELLRWLGDKEILRSAVEQRVASHEQLQLVLVGIVATVSNSPTKQLSPTDVAICALQLLDNRVVRQQIARNVSKLQKISRQQAMKDLWTMREFLRENYNTEAVVSAIDSGLEIDG